MISWLRAVIKVRVSALVLAVIFTFGIVSPVYAQVIKESSCCPDECFWHNIYYTMPVMEGEEIAEIQLALHYLGIYVGRIDGVYGIKTRDAVKSFQKLKNMKESGIVDIQTRDALQKNFEAMADPGTKEAPKGTVTIWVDTKTRTLVVYDDGKPFKTFKVAVGKDSTPTPIGEFKVKRKALNWGSGFGTRWIGLTVPWGIYGIHGTNKPWSIGSNASHGCVRMFNRDVEELYPWVKAGDKVVITGEVFPVRYEDRIILKRGFKGSDVYLVQQKLRELGYYPGEPDGIYGPATMDSVKRFQKDRGFPITGEVDIDIYPAIGL